jgi:hypothetical protein
MLHIDIHGKTDKYDEGKFELGSMPLRHYATVDENQNFIKPFIRFLNGKFNDMLSGIVLNGIPVKCELNCGLHGYWGGEGPYKLHTITEQGVLLGITSI